MRRARVDVTRSVLVPDPIRVERSLRMPELGPRILFFSGGTALRSISRVLKQYTYNSVHLITPFDSGGSSAELRAAFAMPAVGDIRNRLMALADESALGNPATYKLFSYRLGRAGAAGALRAELESMIAGEHDLITHVASPLRQLIRTHLRAFADQMPAEFDLRFASIGNLLLAGGYLANERDMDSVIFLFSKLIEARGIVRPIVADDLTLFARTAAGELVAGQHTITRREPRADDPLSDLWLGPTMDDPTPTRPAIAAYIQRLIGRADLVCYPIGSFFSSLLANLLPEGVGTAIANARCPKVYLPNTGEDPEQSGIDIAAAVDLIVARVRADAGADVPIERILNFVIVDSARGQYATVPDIEAVRARGVQVLDLHVADERDPSRLHPTLATEVLLSLG